MDHSIAEQFEDCSAINIFSNMKMNMIWFINAIKMSKTEVFIFLVLGSEIYITLRFQRLVK